MAGDLDEEEVLVEVDSDDLEADLRDEGELGIRF
jgi:hypothetical protein